MMTTKNLLVELFVEELPPKSLKSLGDSFAVVLADSLREFGLWQNRETQVFATPRRIGVYLTAVLDKALDREISQKLMPASVGLDASGQATPALLKKLASLGLDASFVPKLKCKNDGKSDQLFLDLVKSGMTLADGLQQALHDTLGNLPIPKVMTYPNPSCDGWETVSFVRPAHGLIALHGTDVVPISVLGLNAGRETQGHRFEAIAAKLDVRDADSYETQMESEGAVIPSFEKRRAEIVKQLSAAAAKEKLKPIDDDALLDEVTALVERPNVLLGKFESEFLEVPQECLILTMKANQKYFPLLDDKEKLSNKFLFVSNITPEDASLVIDGNERVIRPRLADAKFFFDQDRKKTLALRVEGLSKVVYHNKLGTQGERVERVRAIAKVIGQQLGGDALASQADQAAMLAKADLLTDMVGEFPELQGIMGRYYAKHDGLSDDIASAIEDHYKPRFAGDELPRNDIGICVALADKLETLVGMFGIGQIPTGDKDPFALRRHALGIVRMLLELNLPLKFNSLLPIIISEFGPLLQHDGPPPSAEERMLVRQRGGGFATLTHQKNIPSQTDEQIIVFIYERLAGLLKDRGFSAQEVNAVLSLNPEVLNEIPKRLSAVRSFAALPEAAALAAANKRVGNILKKVEGSVSDEVETGLLQEPTEQALHQALLNVVPKAEAAFTSGDYAASLQALSGLRIPVDEFFNNVMVNAEDEKLRANRLALLAQLHQAMNRVADISKLAT